MIYFIRSDGTICMCAIGSNWGHLRLDGPLGVMILRCHLRPRRDVVQAEGALLMPFHLACLLSLASGAQE